MDTIDIVIKLTKVGPNSGPFNITTDRNILLDSNVTVRKLIRGIGYSVNRDTKTITLTSIGKCNIIKHFSLGSYTKEEYASVKPKQSQTGCLWRHLTDIQNYNLFYGSVEPYIIEYPFSYQYQDEILQNVKDYTKAYEYLSIPDGVFNYNTKVETNNRYFNQVILYNGQQSSGLINLVPKPKNNLQAYNKYPIFAIDSKTIAYTKSDNFYQYNTFWALQINSQIPLFNTGCQSLSFDKVINQSNMDYSSRSFKKAPLRAKDLKVRHILNNTSTLHLVSQFLTAPSMNSYK